MFFDFRELFHYGAEFVMVSRESVCNIEESIVGIPRRIPVRFNSYNNHWQG